jgi:hypothetical protein
MGISQLTRVCVFVALGIQHAMRMHHVVVYGLILFTILFHTTSWRHNFRKKKSYLMLNVCFEFLYNFFWNIFHSKKNWGLNFLDIFSKNTQIPNFTKIHPERAELFHAERRTDMTQLIVAFHNFSTAPTNTYLLIFEFHCFTVHFYSVSLYVPTNAPSLL